MKNKLFIVFLLVILITLFMGCTSYVEKECEDKSTQEEKGDCYTTFAKNKRDAGFCNQIEYTSLKENCQAEVVNAKIDYCKNQAVSSGSNDPMKCCATQFFGNKELANKCAGEAMVGIMQQLV